MKLSYLCFFYVDKDQTYLSSIGGTVEVATHEEAHAFDMIGVATVY